LGISRLIGLIEKTASIPYYSVIGDASGKIVYVSNRDGLRRTWVYDPVEKKNTPITAHPPVIVAVPRRSESNKIVYTYDAAEGRELHRICIVDIDERRETCIKELEPMRIFSLAWDGESIALTGSTQEKLYLIVFREGRILRKKEFNVYVDVSDVNERYVIGYGMLSGDPRSSEIFVYDIQKDEFKAYTPRKGSINEKPIFCNEKILFESNYEDLDKKKLYTIDTDLSGEPEELVFKYSDYTDFEPVEHTFYDCRNNKIYVVAKKNGRTQVFVDGKRIPAPQGSVSGGLAIIDDTVYYAMSSLVEPHQIYRSTDDSFTEVLTNKLPDELKEAFGERYFVKIRSVDGVLVPTYIVESRKTSKPGPTVIYVHGGPWWEVPDAWSPIIASIIVSGYHVVAPNYRGSTGYGEKYRLLDIGDPGGKDLEDIVSVAKYVVKEGIASSVAITGYSYGGYMTYLATTKYPDLWGAGVAGAGITDWQEQYMLSDALFKKFIEILFDGYKPELLSDRSPIRYADRLACPLCIIHASNDTRTPLKPVMRFMEKLMESQKLFEAHIYPGLGHMVVSTDDLMGFVAPMITFLKKYYVERRA